MEAQSCKRPRGALCRADQLPQRRQPQLHPQPADVPPTLPQLKQPQPVDVPPTLPQLEHPQPVDVPPTLPQLEHPQPVDVPPTLPQLKQPQPVDVPPTLPLHLQPQVLPLPDEVEPLTVPPEQAVQSKQKQHLRLVLLLAPLTEPFDLQQGLQQDWQTKLGKVMPPQRQELHIRTYLQKRCHGTRIP